MAEDFDLKKLQRELETAVVTEEKRVLVDEVKKKAVHTTASYEEFRQRVLAADLKPVSTKEFEGAFRRHKGDRVARNRAISRIDRTGKHANNKKGSQPKRFAAKGATKAAKSAMEFKRHWRRHCKDDASRFTYLRLFKPPRIHKVLKSELDGTLLGEMAAAMAAHLPPATATASAGKQEEDDAAVAAWMASILVALSKVQRFKLTLKLLNDSDRGNLTRIVDRLRDCGVSDDEVSALDAAYRTSTKPAARTTTRRADNDTELLDDDAPSASRSRSHSLDDLL